MDLLSFWGKKIALTAISTEEDIVRFHFGESIFALSLHNLEHGRLADVGSGAGFPGLAIRLFCPNLNLMLLEPNKKKCAFLNEVIRKLEFTGIEVLSIGFEAAQIRSGELTYATSRALGRTGDVLSWSRKTLAPGGRVILWLSADDVAKTIEVPGWHWARTPIPGTATREILLGSLKVTK